MILDIHPDSPVPIYEQIVAQVTFAVAAGDLEAGAMIPSVRDMAQQLLVNPNTVARAFQDLEGLGVVTARLWSLLRAESLKAIGAKGT